MKKTISILLAALMMLSLVVACGAKNPLVGTWELDRGVGEEAEQAVALMKAFGMTMTFTFNADGTGSMAYSYGGESEPTNFNYEVKDGQIVIDGEGADYAINGNELTINVEGTQMVFKKK